MGRYIKSFDSHSDYESFTGTTDFVKPNTSYCIEQNEVHYNGIINYSKIYLTFIAKTDGTFKFSGNTVSYSLDDGDTWATLVSNTNSPTVMAGNKIMWKAELTPIQYSGIGFFSSTGQFDVEGNPMSLLFGDDFKEQTSLAGKDEVFSFLFSGCTGMISAKNMSLPATTLSNSCYWYMFCNCTGLIEAPQLPAITLAAGCYTFMFTNCTALATAPDLPATTLAENCYRFMFVNTAITEDAQVPSSVIPIGSEYCESMYCECNINAPSGNFDSIAYDCGRP